MKKTRSCHKNKDLERQFLWTLSGRKVLESGRQYSISRNQNRFSEVEREGGGGNYFYATSKFSSHVAFYFHEFEFFQN